MVERVVWGGLWHCVRKHIYGTAAGFEGEEDAAILTGFIAGAGVGVGISILLPLMLTLPSSYQRTENEEFNKCYTDGYLRNARATNTGASFLGGLLGGPLGGIVIPVFTIGALVVLLGSLVSGSKTVCDR